MSDKDEPEIINVRVELTRLQSVVVRPFYVADCYTGKRCITLTSFDGHQVEIVIPEESVALFDHLSPLEPR